MIALLTSACAGKTVGAGPDGALLGDGELVVAGAVDANDDSLSFDDSDQPDQPDAPAPTPSGNISMARANWTTGAMQAEVYAQLLEELGYQVDRGTDLAPSEFYPELAAGTYDFWANSWPIVHDKFFDAPSDDGGLIGDRISYVGQQMPVGGLQGILVDVATADRLGISSLDDIAENPDIRAEFDTDGDGRAEIAGCDEGWGCEAVIDALIEDNGWADVLVQMKGVHGELFTQQVARAEAGEPVLAYVWTPGPFITELTPGENAVWLGVKNPSPDQAVAADLPEDQCRLSPCTMGFSPSDIVVAANNDFLAREPAAAELLNQVKISVLDVSFQNLKMGNGEDTPTDIARHASEWIQSNRSDVDRWLTQAQAAG
ncbi:MAG: glycine betaine/L-proline ABC transporter substrate-binding protein ProX [Acidimicrobiales bacterium]